MNKIVVENIRQKRIFYKVFPKIFYDYFRLIKTIVIKLLNRHYDDIFYLVPRFIKKGDVILDVGANIGQYALRLNKFVGKTGKVYSFEPVAYNFRLLKMMKNIMFLNNVEIIKVALCDKRGTETISIPVVDDDLVVGTQAVLENRKRNFEDVKFIHEKVNTETIDIFVSDNNLSNIKFIKIDVEGAEDRVILGALNTIEHYKPLIMLENSESVKLIERYLFRYGYGKYIIQNNKFIEMKDNIKVDDVFFIHSENLVI